jgi:hypothetical protein
MARKKARIGRPPLDPGERTVPVAIALQRKDAEALRRAAAARGVSMSSIVAGLVREWLARQEK